jgi:competence protein ComEA
VQRYLLLAAGLAVAAFAIWHPAPHPSTGFTAGTAPAPSRRARARPSTTASGEEVVYVVGAVARPGLYRVPSGARADDAIRLAGGLLSGAGPAAVNLAERLSDGQEIAVPRFGEAPVPKARSRRGRTRIATPAPSDVDVNAGDAAGLARVPGIGPALAARIVAYRGVNGPFANLDELLDVAGMTPARLDRASQYLVIPR